MLKEVCVKDRAILYILYQLVDGCNFEKIVSRKSSKEVWDILEKTYKGDDRVKQVQLQTLKGELESMKMKEAEGVAEYITWVEIVIQKYNHNWRNDYMQFLRDCNCHLFCKFCRFSCALISWIYCMDIP